MAPFLRWVILGLALIVRAGAAPGPCDQIPPNLNTAGKSTFCVAFTLDHTGKVAIRPELSQFHGNDTYKSFSTARVTALRTRWNLLIAGALARLPALYEFILTDPEREQEKENTLPAATKAEIAKLQALPENWAEARPLLARFARCPDRPQPPCNRRGPDQTLEQAVTPIANADFMNSSPLSHIQVRTPNATAWLIVDDLIQDFQKQVQVQVKSAGLPLQPKRTVVTPAWVTGWLEHNEKSEVWVATDIRQQITDTLSGVGVQPGVTASRAGEPPKITVETGLVHRVQMPGDLNPGTGSGKTEILKILNILLAAEDYSVLLRKTSNLEVLIPQVGAGPLTFRELDISRIRDGKGLHYLDLFEFANQQAALQAIGYSVSTQAESLDDTSLATPFILTVTRPEKQAPKKAESAPDPARRAGPPPLQPKAVTAAPPGTPPPALSLPHMTYGAGVQYRSGQGFRPLVSIGSNSLATPWGKTSFQFTGGVDNTNPVAALDIHNDYIAFGTLHHRLSFDFTGKTDSTAKRLLGGFGETDVQRTGGHGRLEYDPVRNWNGLFLQLFAEGARDNLVLSRSGADIPHVTLWTADIGATLDLAREARLLPGRFELTPLVHFGWDPAPGMKPYRIASIDALAHQRISDTRLISVDISAHFRDSSAGAPLFELPSLGGSESLRGFRQDDLLARRFWSVQSELWVPVPGTVSALPAAAVRRFLRQNIRIAFFLDAGGAYQLPAYERAAVSSGTRFGPGAGIRFIRGNFALKLDWAYGRGRGQSGDGHGRGYLGIVQNGAF